MNTHRKILQKNGLKITEQRLLVLEVMHKNKRHFTAEEIFAETKKRQQNIGYASVYRALTQFEECGIVVKRNFGHVAIYELKSNDEHDHLVCERCGLVVEFYDKQIEKIQKKISRENNFVFTKYDHYIFGICPKCQKTSKTNAVQ